MDSVISITVFLVPGLVASRLNAALDPNYKDRNRESSELESTIYAILNNLPGILIGWLLWSVIEQKALSFAEWSGQISQLSEVFTYLCISFLLAFGVERIVKPKLIRWVAKKRNEQRTSNGLPSFDDAESWEVFLGSEEELCMRITSLLDGTESSVTGVLRSAFKPEDLSQGITLENTDEMAGLNQWLYLPVRTYIDAQTGLVYELFTKAQLEIAKTLQDSTDPPKQMHQGTFREPLIFDTSTLFPARFVNCLIVPCCIARSITLFMP